LACLGLKNTSEKKQTEFSGGLKERIGKEKVGRKIRGNERRLNVRRLQELLQQGGNEAEKKKKADMDREKGNREGEGLSWKGTRGEKGSGKNSASQRQRKEKGETE